MIERILHLELAALLREYIVVTILGPRQSGKTMTHYGQRPNLHFYRDNHGQEIDILFKRGKDLIGVEIKSSATLHSGFLRTLNRIDEMVLSLNEKYIVYSGRETRQYSSGVTALNFKSTGRIVSGSKLKP